MAAIIGPLQHIDVNRKPATTGPILAVDNLVKRFETPDGVLTAVDHVSLGVAPGEFLGVIGPSGCGKSTLFNVIGGLLDGYEGTVQVAGERMHGEQLVDALQIGARREQDGRAAARCLVSAGARQQQRHGK